MTPASNRRQLPIGPQGTPAGKPNTPPGPPRAKTEPQEFEPDAKLYLRNMGAQQKPLRFVFLDGKELTGTVVRFGKFTVEVRVGDETVVVHKHAVARIHETSLESSTAAKAATG